MECNPVPKTMRRLVILFAAILIVSLLMSGYSIYKYTTLATSLEDPVAPSTVDLNTQQATDLQGCNVAAVAPQDGEVLTLDDTNDYGEPGMSVAYPFPKLDAVASNEGPQDFFENHRNSSPVEIAEDNGYTMCDCGDCFATGSYVGDDTDDRSIYVGFRPDFVMVFEGGRHTIRNSAMSGDYSCTDNGACSADMIQAFENDGFQIGTNYMVNNSYAPNGYYWVAWTDD